MEYGILAVVGWVFGWFSCRGLALYRSKKNRGYDPSDSPPFVAIRYWQSRLKDLEKAHEAYLAEAACFETSASEWLASKNRATDAAAAEFGHARVARKRAEDVLAQICYARFRLHRLAEADPGLALGDSSPTVVPMVGRR